MNRKTINGCLGALLLFLFMLTFAPFLFGIYLNIGNYKIWQVRDSFYPELFEVKSIDYWTRTSSVSKRAIGKVRGKEFNRPAGNPKNKIGVGSKVPVWYSKSYPELLPRNSGEMVFDYSKYHKSVRIGFALTFPFLFISFLIFKLEKHIKTKEDN